MRRSTQLRSRLRSATGRLRERGRDEEPGRKHGKSAGMGPARQTFIGSLCGFTDNLRNFPVTLVTCPRGLRGQTQVLLVARLREFKSHCNHLPF